MPRRLVWHCLSLMRLRILRCGLTTGLLFEMFLRCQTQWRTTSAGVCGFDYVALEWLFRLYEVEDQPTVLENLQVMEAAAVKILNKESK